MSEDDSTDWIDTAAPFLTRFEDNLRCPICRELLVRAPSMTECGHTFCGECIMRHFNSSEKCPVCRSSIQRGKLRKNKAIGDLVDLWQSGVRGALLELVTSIKTPHPHISNDHEVEVISDSDNETSNSPNSEAPEALSNNERIPEGHAVCPVCSKVLPIAEIQTSHISKCLDQSPAPSSSPYSGSEGPSQAKRRKRAVFGQEFPESKLSVPHFHSMNDTKLRAKAKEAGLSIKGSRQRIISRYVEWLTVWNASVGDKHPRSIANLRRHIMEWDKAQDRIGDGAPNLKSLDAQAWSQQNNDSFTSLIAKARTNKKATPHDSNATSEIPNNEVSTGPSGSNL